MLENKLLIAGPCALESEADAQLTIEEAQQSGIRMVRMNLWKPRTRAGGYEGAEEEGLSWLQMAIRANIGVAIEVMLPEQAEATIEVVKRGLLAVPHGTLLLWIGSRNQNHLIQREIASVVGKHPGVQLMLKNQPWRDERHWKGMVSHVLQGGVKKEQILLCHRGFAPWEENGVKYRNIPDIEMAKRIKEELEIPMILDPSHIGGTVHLVRELAREYQQLPWIDGQLIEVHPNPLQAETDSEQQLTWDQLRKTLAIQEVA